MKGKKVKSKKLESKKLYYILIKNYFSEKEYAELFFFDASQYKKYIEENKRHIQAVFLCVKNELHYLGYFYEGQKQKRVLSNMPECKMKMEDFKTLDL